MSNSDEKLNSIPKGRTSSLLSMAAKVALKEGKNILQKRGDKRLLNMMEQADIIVRHVGQLKGAAMKAVQMMTVELHDLIPPEVLNIFEKLQSQAPPLSDELMIANLRKELGDELFFQLEDISSEPLASASIGQVYQAQYKGNDIVIKVQYPEIAGSIDSDIETLKKLVKALNFVTNKQVSIDELFSEVRRILIQETNYYNEENLLKQYSEAFSKYDDYRVPKVYPEFTRNGVIVLSKEDGEEFTDWLKSGPSQTSKEKVGQLFLDLYMKEFFENQLVQTDPNPANFLVNQDDKLVLLDFGATVAYDDQFVADYKKLVLSVFTGSDTDILAEIMNMRFISEKESDETKQMFVDFLRLSMVPFEPERQPFDFSKKDYSDEVRKSAIEFTKKLKYSAPPKQIIFLHRKLGGIFQILRKLEVQVDMSDFRQKVLNLQ
ncbi:MAG: AarF/ABC1/UbiB kinase family protein [Bdellovibrionales bacterium]|nr:AarF/ABC1/UbiB kinase family protein [Bdellovibrionales bacterium]NQZ17659.1 AarF/ABC1/UbiB kinase family protein [Bdellovibrionales bacterium]